MILSARAHIGYSAREYYDRYMNIVAVGTVADVVSLTDETGFRGKRIKKIQNTQNEGLKALFQTAGIAGKPINAGMISFTVAPRINALRAASGAHSLPSSCW